MGWGEPIATIANLEYELEEARSEINRHHDLIQEMKSLLGDARRILLDDCALSSEQRGAAERIRKLLKRKVG